MVSGTWKANPECAKRRLIDSCFDCIRFERGQCKEALEKFKKVNEVKNEMVRCLP